MIDSLVESNRTKKIAQMCNFFLVLFCFGKHWYSIENRATIITKESYYYFI